MGVFSVYNIVHILVISLKKNNLSSTFLSLLSCSTCIYSLKTGLICMDGRTRFLGSHHVLFVPAPLSGKKCIEPPPFMKCENFFVVEKITYKRIFKLIS
jgi:hypothetical protein